ncbi:hypothetical protein [Bordetella sp. 2513F-2]
MTHNRIASILLAAVVFEMDAVPASRCALDGDDLAAARGPDPAVKVLFLSTTQEKAVVVRRGEDLYEPIVLRNYKGDDSARRGVSIGKTVTCYDIRA